MYASADLWPIRYLITVSLNAYGRLQDRREKESFFNFFYLSINLGSLLAVTVLVYIQVRMSHCTLPWPSI